MLVMVKYLDRSGKERYADVDQVLRVDFIRALISEGLSILRVES